MAFVALCDPNPACRVTFSASASLRGPQAMVLLSGLCLSLFFPLLGRDLCLGLASLSPKPAPLLRLSWESLIVLPQCCDSRLSCSSPLWAETSILFMHFCIPKHSLWGLKCVSMSGRRLPEEKAEFLCQCKIRDLPIRRPLKGLLS